MSEAEATKLVREAEQAEAKKNVFFQPRPDWEKAADCYQKAALILRSPALKKTDAAVCAFDKASVAHAKCGAKFFAGVALENAANVLRDARCLSAAAAKYAQASEMFLLGDNIEKGSEALIKAAKASAEEQPDFAIQYYLDVIAIFEESDKHVYISDTWRSALGLMLRRGRLEDAAKLLQRMCPTFARLEQADYLYKAQLSLVVVHLARADVGAAKEALDKFEGLVDSAEGRAAMELVDKFQEGDFEKVAELTKDQTFTLLANEVGRTARTLADKCKEIAGDMTGKYEETLYRPPEVQGGAGGQGDGADDGAPDDGDDMDDLL